MFWYKNDTICQKSGFNTHDYQEFTNCCILSFSWIQSFFESFPHFLWINSGVIVVILNILMMDLSLRKLFSLSAFTYKSNSHHWCIWVEIAQTRKFHLSSARITTGLNFHPTQSENLIGHKTISHGLYNVFI